MANSKRIDLTTVENDGRGVGLTLTQSEMMTWLSDRRKWYLAYYRQMRPIRDEGGYAASVGSLYHLGLEAYYREKADPLGRVEAACLRLINGGLSERAVEETLKAAELAGIMLEGYLEWCPNEDAHLRVIAAEQKVEVPVGRHTFRGKIDARAIDERTDTLVQLEHKTVMGLDDLPKFAQSNFQFLSYDLAAALLAKEEGGRRTDGVLLNMARRVKRTPRATPPFYGRHTVRHNLEELNAHYQHITAIGGQIALARAELTMGASHHLVCPPRVTRDVTWANPYFPLYRVMDDGGDWEGMLADLYEPYDPMQRYEEGEE